MIFNIKTPRVQAQLNTNRFDSNFKRAKKRLNMLVVGDSTPYIPFQQGQLRSQVRYPDGIYGDYIEWYAPYAHYQYNGTVLTDEMGRTFVEAGQTKTVDTGRPLSYKENGTTDHWFEEAKRVHYKEWEREIRTICGRG